MRGIFESTFEPDDSEINNGDPLEKTMSLPEFLEALLKVGKSKHQKDDKTMYI